MNKPIRFYTDKNGIKMPWGAKASAERQWKKDKIQAESLWKEIYDNEQKQSFLENNVNYEYIQETIIKNYESMNYDEVIKMWSKLSWEELPQKVRMQIIRGMQY